MAYCYRMLGSFHEAEDAPEPGGGHRLHTLQIFTVTGGRVAHNVVFADPRVFEAFDLPQQIFFGEFRQAR